MHQSDERLYPDFGRLVRQYRDRQGLTQEKLGRATGFARTSITNIEKGRQHVALHQLYAIAEALNVSPEVLLPQRNREEALPTISDKMPSGTERAVAEWAERIIREGE